MNILTKSKREPSQRKTLSSIFKEYCKNCSLHGFCYFYKSSNRLIHCFWVSIILGSIVLCGYLGMMIFQKFVVNPTLTVVESIHHPMTEVPFPAVTVCDPEVVYGPNTENITNILALRGFNSSQIREFYKSFMDQRYPGYQPAPYLRKMHDLLHNLHLPLNALLKLLKKPCEVLLVSCAWRSKIYNCSVMFREVFINHLFCCQFDLTYFQSNAENQTNFISGKQNTEALDIIVDTRKYEPDGNKTEGHVLLYVFDQQDTVTFLDNSVTIAPATHFDVGVEVWTIDSSDYVKALAVKSRKCILRSDPTFSAGFYHGCLSAVIMRHVVEICHCLPYFTEAKDLNVDVQKTCSWESLTCIYENLDKVLGNMKNVIAESECYQRCDYIQYDTDTKYIRQQRRFDDLPDSLSMICVHFVDNTCLKYRREVLYTWDQVLANLGGIFGLCLGGSIISIIEVIWFTFDLLYNIIKNKFTRKSMKKKIKQKDLIKMWTSEKGFDSKYKFNN